MDAEVRPATPSDNGRTLVNTVVEHPFVVPGLDDAPSRQAASEFPIGEQESQPNSTSATTLPRLASVHGSHSGSRNDVENMGVNSPGPDEEPETDSTRRSSGSFSGNVNVLRGDSIADQEVVVLTPSRLRLDSRVVMAHATLQWLTNAIWAVLIWQKLEGRLHCSWWAVFSPTIVNHLLHIPMQLIVLRLANYMVYKQIGPPPPPTATAGLVLQYAILQHVRLRSHRVDWANNAIESTAVFVVKLLFCNALQRGTLWDTPLRLIFTPIWVCWVVTFVLLCLKDRTERMFGSSRDLFFIFLLFVAFKVDEQSSYSWRVVFLVPWMWFSGLLLVAAMVFLLLLFAKVWARPRELLLPIGFLLLLLSTIPQFVSYIALVRRLDGDTGTSIASILWPNALSWLLMWLSAGVIGAALRQKEAVRNALLARGAVWTAHEGVARRLHAERDEAQRRVDELSEEEVARLVESMMAGKSKPGRLRRVGENLYKRIASLEPALAEQAAQGALAATGGSGAGAGSGTASGGGSGSSLSTPTASTTAAAAAATATATAAAAAAAGCGEAGVPSPSGPGPGGLEAAADGDASMQPLAGSSSTGRDSPAADADGGGGGGGGAGGGGLGMFRSNRVVPLGRPAGAPAGPVTAATASTAAVAAAGRSPRGLDGGSTAAGPGAAVAAAAAAAGPAQAAAVAAVAVDSVAAAPRGSLPVLASAASSAWSGRSGSGWLGSVAGGTTAAGSSLELTGREEGRDVESGAGPLRNRSRAQPEGSAPSPQAQAEAPPSSGPLSPSQTSRLAGPFSRYPSEAGAPSGSGASGTALGPAAAGGQKRSRPSQVAPRQRPASASAAPDAPAVAAAAAAGETSSARPVAGTSGLGVLAAAAKRPSSASTPQAASGAAAAPPGPSAVADSIARPSSAPAENGGTASTRPDAGVGPGEGEEARTTAAGAGDGGSASGEQAGPSEPAAGAGAAPASASTSFALRSPAVLLTAEADLEAPQQVGPQGGDAGPAAPAAADAAGAGASGSAAPGAPASPAPASSASEREDVANESPAAADSHTPRVEGSVEAGAAAGSGGGAAAAAIAAAAGDGSDDPDSDNACVICYDGEATCVFLECGHGGFCRRCAFLLFVRPPNECPTCRAVIDQVVEIEPVAAVGQVAKVK